jgi:glycosyltransferase involved in cell wall biosynthesis
MISVLILTYNEEINLPMCLESLRWSDDIVVFDSFSTDRTVEIANAAGCRVIQRKFDNWSSHQNWAVQNIKFKHAWVYYSDADEVVTPELAAELKTLASAFSRDEVAYRLRFKNMFLGKWIKHSSIYPTWVMRFFRPQCVRWERVVNPVAVINGREGHLQNHFLHHSFRKGFYEWFRKHNSYSTGEALEAIRILSNNRGQDWAGIFSSDRVRRRAALKELSFRLPLRSSLIFLYLMFIRRGVFDGPAGWKYCRMRAYYEFMISAKITELHRMNRGQSN